MTWRKHLFPSPFNTLIWRPWIQTPWPAKKFRLEFQLFNWRDAIHAQADFPIALPPNTLYCCYLDPFFLLILESLSKLYIATTMLPTDFPIFFWCNSSHSHYIFWSESKIDTNHEHLSHIHRLTFLSFYSIQYSKAPSGNSQLELQYCIWSWLIRSNLSPILVKEKLKTFSTKYGSSI